MLSKEFYPRENSDSAVKKMIQIRPRHPEIVTSSLHEPNRIPKPRSSLKRFESKTSNHLQIDFSPLPTKCRTTIQKSIQDFISPCNVIGKPSQTSPSAPAKSQHIKTKTLTKLSTRGRRTPARGTSAKQSSNQNSKAGKSTHPEKLAFSQDSVDDFNISNCSSLDGDLNKNSSLSKPFPTDWVDDFIEGSCSSLDGNLDKNISCPNPPETISREQLSDYPYTTRLSAPQTGDPQMGCQIISNNYYSLPSPISSEDISISESLEIPCEKRCNNSPERGRENSLDEFESFFRYSPPCLSLESNQNADIEVNRPHADRNLPSVASKWPNSQRKNGEPLANFEGPPEVPKAASYRYPLPNCVDSKMNIDGPLCADGAKSLQLLANGRTSEANYNSSQFVKVIRSPPADEHPRKLHFENGPGFIECRCSINEAPEQAKSNAKKVSLTFDGDQLFDYNLKDDDVISWKLSIKRAQCDPLVIESSMD